jgi:succinate dehydrogenase/fumarate reductase flavoprotein subunit
MMGGVRTDEACGTDLPGLFACGEVTWGLHGANRRGGNALMECAVFGTLAGRNAAQFKSSDPKGIASDNKGPWEDRTAGTKTGHKTLGQIKDEIRRTAWIHAGVIRSADGLRKGLDASFLIGRELEGIVPENRREVCLKADLTAAVLTLKAVIVASLGRQESRGSFYRDDYPREDDVNWRKNSSLTYDPATGSFAVDYIPVS